MMTVSCDVIHHKEAYIMTNKFGAETLYTVQGVDNTICRSSIKIPASFDIEWNTNPE